MAPAAGSPPWPASICSPNGTGSITINGRDIDEYFGLDTLKMVVRQPLEATGIFRGFTISKRADIV